MIPRRFLPRFLGPCTLLAVLQTATFAQSEPPRPNVLFLFTDDQRADTLSSLGSTTCRTPNLDRIVTRGTAFGRAYCQGSHHGAVCVPSRAMTLSGRALHRVAESMEGVETLPERLRRRGYRTFATGKWHNGKPALQRLFDEGRNVFFGGMCDHEQVPVQDWDGKELSRVRRGESFSSTLFADAAVGFLERQASDAPWFAWVAFTAPHDPRQPRPEWVARTLPEAGDLPPNFLPQHPFDNGWLTGRDEALAAWPRTEEVVRAQRREYVALIEHLDGEVGRILDALERRADATRTIVVLASDHGLAVGSHGLLGKQSLYEHSQRAVLALRGPGVPSGERRDALVYLFDVAPTLLDLAGLDPLPETDGISLVPVLQDAAHSVRDAVFTRFARGQRALTTRRYKLIRYPHVAHSQLFDLREDPDEWVDLASEPEHQERRARLEARLRAAMSAAGDELPFTAAEPKPLTVDLTGHPRQPDRWQPPWIVEKYFGGR